jgi:hypothetical protein
VPNNFSSFPRVKNKPFHRVKYVFNLKQGVVADSDKGKNEQGKERGRKGEMKRNDEYP